MNVLTATSVTKSFGGVKALDGCDLAIEEGTVVGLIGPNGAGKSTLFNVLSGLVRPTTGEVTFQGKSITRSSTSEIARLGAVKTFQVPREFNSLTVLENLLVADPSHRDRSVVRAWFHFRGRHNRMRELAVRAGEILSFLKLEKLALTPAANLSTGQKKLLDLGRALMLSPTLLLLDEPLAGVSPSLAVEIIDHLWTLKERGVSVAVIEHRIDFVKDLCDTVYVLADGTVLLHGPPSEALSHKSVIDAFFGAES